MNLQDLYWRGITESASRFHAVEHFREYLKTCAVWTAHVRAQGEGPFARGEVPDQELLSHSMINVLSAPGFFAWAMQYLPAVAKFLGQKPQLYSFNAFWTRPGQAPLDPNIQQWHRDRDDEKFIALFMYGTDVESIDDGPHMYAMGSHRAPDDGNRAPLAAERVHRVFGKAGTCFLEQPFGLHMGPKPVRGERLLAWARWGVSEKPKSYGWDKLEPVPASACGLEGYSDEVKATTSLVVDWSK